jgi:hypothetical protein
MPQLGNITVSITDPLTATHFAEYDVTSNGKRAACHIQSNAGQEFQILVQHTDSVHANGESFKVNVSLDGRSTGLRDYLGRWGERFHATLRLWSKDIGGTKRVPFLFGNTQFTGCGYL